VSWSILAPIIALAITFAVAQVVVVLTGAIRKRDYRLFEDRSKESFASQFPIATLDRSAAEERRKAAAKVINRIHQAANKAQTRYHNAVVRSAGCLVAAFIALVLGTLREEDWQLMGGLPVHHQLVEQVLTWIDAIAILLVLILFLYAGAANRRWIAARVGTELLRQYQFLNVVFPCVNSEQHADERKSQFDLEAEAVKARVQAGPVSEIISRIEQFWSQRDASIEKRALGESDIPADALLVYLEGRVRRQLGWFADSKARLEHIAERRRKLLLWLYSVAAAVAVGKLVLFLSSGESPAWLLRFLLIMTGISGAMTAYYINQNARSLIHRYNTQQRRIAEWLKSFKKSWNFADPLSESFNAQAKDKIRDRILEFEDLMIEELIDWVHITSQDVIELAP
jgi:SMODS and SLOG-associating 2TM effector domain 1